MGPHGKEHDHIDDDQDEVDQDCDYAAEDGGGHLAHSGRIDQGSTRLAAGDPEAPLRSKKLAGFGEDVADLFLELGPVHGKPVYIPIDQQYDSRHEAYEYDTAENGCYEPWNFVSFEPAGGAHKHEGEDAGEGQGHKDGAGKIEHDAAENNGEEDGAIV